MEHVNAEILRAIADGEKVQYRKRHSSSGWEFFDSSDGFLCWKLLKGSAIEWRIAPKTIKTIKIGDFEVPEPCKVVLAYGQDYYIPHLTAGADWRTWNDDKHDARVLKSNLVHLDSHAAALHAKALIEVSKGWWK